jgi:hypothetical protein
MARKKSVEPEPEVPLYWGMTPNQVVAYNLNQARVWKGWTQEQAADALAPFVGSRRTVDGRAADPQLRRR